MPSTLSAVLRRPAPVLFAFALASCEAPTGSPATGDAPPLVDGVLRYLPEDSGRELGSLGSLAPFEGSEALALAGATISTIYPPPGGSTGGACWFNVQVDASGMLYVGFGRLVRLTQAGAVLDSDLSPFVTGGGNSVVLDESAGKFFSTNGNNVLSAPFQQGAVFSTFATGVVSGQGITTGRGPLAGDVFVGSHGFPSLPARLSRVTVSPPSVSVFALGFPFISILSVTSGPDGSLYSANFEFGVFRLYKTTPAGVTTLFAQPGPGETGSRMAAVDADGNVYWGVGPVVKKYSPAGQVLGSFGPHDKPAFEGLAGHAWDADGNLYFVDNWQCKKVYKVTFSPAPPNQAPTVVVNSASGTEGSATTLTANVNDADGDQLSVTWDFGDGSAPVTQTNVTGGALSMAHVYAGDGSYTVTVSAADGNFAPVTATGVAQIANVIPAVSAQWLEAFVLAGEAARLSASFADPGAEPSGWQYDVDWGDGSSSGALAAPGPGTSFQAAHTYAAPGCYSAVVRVREVAGSTGDGVAQATVCVMLPVSIDIKPGDDLNTIRLSDRTQGNASVAIAVLSSATFDAATLIPSTLALVGETGLTTPIMLRNNGSPHAALEDVNGDGRPDLVAHFERSALTLNGTLTATTTRLCARGQLGNGLLAQGCDTVRPLQ